MAEALPSMFTRVENLKLKKSFVGMKGVRFVEKLERGSAILSRYDRSTDTISIYPMSFRSNSRVDVAFYNGLGLRHWELNVPSHLKAVWKQKLIQPNLAVMDRLNVAFKSGFTDYKQILNKFTSAVERLQVLHVINTLIDHNVKPQEAEHLDIYAYPPIEDFCKGLTPYSLLPLLSAYRGTLDNYEDAFSEYCTENGKLHASESSVEFELIELFKYCSGM